MNTKNVQNQMKEASTIIGFAVFICMFLSCDPTYSIGITNKTAKPATLFVLENNNFRSDHLPVGVNNDGLNIYFLEPYQTINVGMAIAELEDDMPFSKLIIKKHLDSISTQGSDELTSLFDMGWFGGFKKPYHIRIEN